MGMGLVLFKISTIDRHVGQNYHLFFENNYKPPLDVAVNPEDGLIEYISYFIQDEKIDNMDIVPKIKNENIDIEFLKDMFINDNMNITIKAKFKFWKFQNSIFILKENICEFEFDAYLVDELNCMLFLEDEFVGIQFKELTIEEFKEIQNSKCL